mmetsp:Transcript_7346/g.10573  ORF Transcript_7346/g.10573 Transcript_7346/m.10573 type:complete len:130 (-) Transcript_7346:419-808(-)|eukprot:CAMPEP_0195017268 /NCGR_PEP_ID=MMETSP0326_2-20130528/26760_1 /TAXON_ID=2866 ORGANISM="Crypthecodinium cohnii, Strain Seligo" /NCGR_SAMPLE_ID=MMETSP0326_2 /ASSEMBLY_ACC=CAM_ASM_000348 /LENGTH=129 /DNA_ID=CAMNT_0040033627 /DNA_START=206 /DNA_END=598 /DNA_ORIENTATION=+
MQADQIYLEPQLETKKTKLKETGRPKPPETLTSLLAGRLRNIPAQLERRIEGARDHTNPPPKFAAPTSRAGIICFFRESTPGSTASPSESTWTLKEASTNCVAVTEEDTKIDFSFKMSTTKKRTSQSPS